MESNNTRELTDYTDNDLLSLVLNRKNIDKKRLAEIIDELKKRGYAEKVAKIENDLIQLNPVYASFWNRAGTFVIDILILAVVGFILCFFFGDTFARMGSQGLLVGFIISLVYFGLGNSNVFNGQTIGKQVLKLKTVDKNHDLLSVQTSLLRVLIFTVPYFFLNYRLEGWSETSFFFISKGVLFTAFLIILPIHLLLNTPTRQALHDLFSGTYVISKEAYPMQLLKKSRRVPLYISGLILLVLISTALFFRLQNNEFAKTLKELAVIKTQIDELDEVGSSAILKKNTSYITPGTDGSNTRSGISVNIGLKNNLLSGFSPQNIEDIDLVQNAVRIILKSYPNADQLDFIQINLAFGYNIGIYKSSQSMGLSNSIEEWMQKIH